jgi:hypothetical protein
METVTLACALDDGSSYQATFAPLNGMNLISFKRGNVEVIDPATRGNFEERSSGLGPLIGPHFYRRRPELVPKVPDESLFPHIAKCRAKGILDPFSHGVARYCPWKVEVKENEIKGEILGKDLWNGVPLSLIEGQNFLMRMKGSLSKEGLSINLSVVSDTDSVVGIHYYYRLPNGKGRVISRTRSKCISDGAVKDIPAEWGYNQETGELNFGLDRAVDATFSPALNPLNGDIRLETEEYTLRTIYHCLCEENSWQLYHPQNASFVCMEPISAKDPRHANLSVSSLAIQLQISGV